MAHYWRVQKSRIKQSNLDSFFKRVDKRPPTDEPPKGQSPKTIRNDDSFPSTSMWFFMMIIRESFFIFSLGKIVYAFNVRLFTLFIKESLFIVFTKERRFMLFKFTFTVYKS